MKYCCYYFTEVQFCLALKCHPFGFCDAATLTHILCFYWSLSFLVNLKISKARMQLTASQGKSFLRTFYFKIKITFCFPKHIIYKQLSKKDAWYHKLIPHGHGWRSVCVELEQDPYTDGAFSWAWYWQNRKNGECYSKDIDA